MLEKGIHSFSEFDEFHQMANGGLSSRHHAVQVFEFSEIQKESKTSIPLFKTNFYQIGLFSEVCFEVAYFEKPQTINHKNVVVMFKPGQIVSFRKTDPNAKGYAIMFKEQFIDWNVSNSKATKDFSLLNPDNDSVLFLDSTTFNDLLDIAQKMHVEYGRVLDNTAINILRLYSQLLMEKISRISSPGMLTDMYPVHYKTTQHFKALVYQNIQKTKSVSDYAEMLCLTEKTLINHFKQITATTPKYFINTVIIEESKTLLNHKLTVEEVADYFNFTDQAHFSNFFKKKTGQTPIDFKNR